MYNIIEASRHVFDSLISKIKARLVVLQQDICDLNNKHILQPRLLSSTKIKQQQTLQLVQAQINYLLQDEQLKASLQSLPKASKTCSNCHRCFDTSYYVPVYYHFPVKLTNVCQVCRTAKRNRRHSETCKEGLWIHFWKDVKQIITQPCVVCNTIVQLEIDHDPKFKKVANLSNVIFWSRQGPEAYGEELNKVRSLICKGCHQQLCLLDHRKKKVCKPLSSKQKYQQSQYIINRENKIKVKTNDPSLENLHVFQQSVHGKLGQCRMCGKRCTRTNHAGFDFNHINAHKKQKSFADIFSKCCLWSHITQLFCNESDVAGGCELLCSTCHKLVTQSQKLYNQFF